MQPLVTVLITAKERPEELRRTLRLLRDQRYSPLELIVIDDASRVSLEDIVREEWPAARFVRNETNRGLIANRSTGMRMASGAYVISLDDDSCFTDPSDIGNAVARMERESKIGILTFFVFHGPAVPEGMERPEERYVSNFIGCGHMLRSEVITGIGGYRDLYFYYGEEAEYSLRVLDAGWRILLFPSVLVHHRVSQAGRKSSSIARFSLRNNLWTIVLNMPWSRVVTQGAWRLFSHTVECCRLLHFGAAIRGVGGFVAGLPKILALRKPVSAHTVALYDALRIECIRTPEQYASIRKPKMGEALRHYWASWKNRPRARAFWDKRPGDIGRSDEVAFAHEFLPKQPSEKGIPK